MHKKRISIMNRLCVSKPVISILCASLAYKKQVIQIPSTAVWSCDFHLASNWQPQNWACQNQISVHGQKQCRQQEHNDNGVSQA